ncbi:MAG: acyl-CoA desaturase [Myxococcota bacterium]
MAEPSPEQQRRSSRRRSRLSPRTWRLIDRSAVALVLTLPTAGVVVALSMGARGDWPDPANLVVFAILWASTLLGIEAGYHRYFSHASFKTGAVFEVVLALLGSMAFQGPVVWWAAMHRRHHRHADDEGDPHSPQLRGGGLRGTLRGLWDAHMAWLFQEVDSISRKSRWADLVPDLLANRRIWWVHRRYPHWLALGLLLPAGLGGMLTGSGHGALMGLLWGGLVRIFVVNHTIWAVNSICHVHGRRPFALHARDRSTNNAWVAWLSFGAGWHHNHHVFPGSATTRIEWWQLDVSGLVLAALARLGITWDLRTPPASVREGLWSRRVFTRLEVEPSAAAPAPVTTAVAEVTALRSHGAFVETTASWPVGTPLVLRDLRARDRRGQPERMVDMLPLHAVVERVAPGGLKVRFEGVSKDARASIAALRQRHRVRAPYEP